MLTNFLVVGDWKVEDGSGYGDWGGRAGLERLGMGGIGDVFSLFVHWRSNKPDKLKNCLPHHS